MSEAQQQQAEEILNSTRDSEEEEQVNDLLDINWPRQAEVRNSSDNILLSYIFGSVNNINWLGQGCSNKQFRQLPR